MFIGKEANMKITLKLYTNRFPHEGKTLISASVMAWKDGIEIVGCMGTHAYASETSTVDCGMELWGMRAGVRDMLENLGFEVEVDDDLQSLTSINEALEREVLA